MRSSELVEALPLSRLSPKRSAPVPVSTNSACEITQDDFEMKRSGSLSSDDSSFPDEPGGSSLAFGSGFCIPDTYHIPPRYLRDIFRILELRDGSIEPGKVKYRTIEGSILRFHNVLDGSPDQTVTCAIQEIKKRVQGRCGPNNVDVSEALVRWEQTIVFNCFNLKLSMMERIFFTFDISENSTLASKSISWIVMLAVLTSILSFLLGTTGESFNEWIPVVDITCISIFTVDYVARLATVAYARCELLNPEFLHDIVTGKRACQQFSRARRLTNFIFKPMGIVDFISIVPFWVQFALGGVSSLVEDDTAADGQIPTSVFRVLQVVRVSRVFKLSVLSKVDLGEERNTVWLLFFGVVKKAFPALVLVGILVVFALLVFGSLIWAAERGDLFVKGDPNCPLASLCEQGPVRLRASLDGSYETSPSPFDSIPTSFWWVLVTITTVGYGDFYPVTRAGYVVGSMTILYGTVVFALPVGVIGNTFSKLLEQFQEDSSYRHTMNELHEASLPASEEEEIHMRNSIGEQFAGLPMPLVEFMLVLRHVAGGAEVRYDILARWEERMTATVRFEGLPHEHPGEALDRFGNCVFPILRELLTSDTAEISQINQVMSAWYRLHLYAAMVYEEAIAKQPWSRCAFDNAWRSSSKLLASGNDHALGQESRSIVARASQVIKNVISEPARSESQGSQGSRWRDFRQHFSWIKHDASPSQKRESEPQKATSGCDTKDSLISPMGATKDVSATTPPGSSPVLAVLQASTADARTVASSVEQIDGAASSLAAAPHMSPAMEAHGEDLLAGFSFPTERKTYDLRMTI
eukprot:TRINITY_DN30379_c0_g1_i1.p1 TRINITY_DN30379_c0_g1~~TRINITY_DN30379_c0_g1_i1.p1  ORF type:complete len:809 (+),score=92.26 TRINITY_DN30379_c0_g1_i1:138-2564(+)